MEQLQTKKWFIFRAVSQDEFTIQAGKVKIFNKNFDGPITVTCNAGDSYIIYSESLLDVVKGKNIEIEEVLNNPIPEDWMSLKIWIEPVVKNTILLLGESDSGKTTLIKYLALNFINNNNPKVAIADIDVGQNSIGLPGTLNLAEYSLKTSKLVFTKFFGFISPAGNANLYITVLSEFIQQIQAMGYSWLFIDTSGYIQTSEALDINKRIISVCKPQYVILLGEQAHSLEKKLPTRVVSYKKISSAVKGIKKEKLPEIRKQKRIERFKKYFLKSISKELPIEKILRLKIYDRNQRIELEDNNQIKLFLNENQNNLENLFISINSDEQIIICYAKILTLNNELLKISIPEGIILPSNVILELGGIYLTHQ